MSRYLLYFVVLFVLTAGCHEIGNDSKRWTVAPEVTDSVQTDDGHSTTVQFTLEGNANPVVLNGVKVLFLTQNETVRNETALGTVEIDWNGGRSFTVTTPMRPYYINLRYDSVERPTDAGGGVVGLRLVGSGEGEYRYITYGEYTATY
ncbi:hypothetical protein C475_00100 [Halosimplex carlsbadense 2-9-1]|uniref:Uncharacterized protein n=1 Tax=Halosimplex carlsbadense 2-9-1 TaxID=797114 RepID=M0D6R7_9EURY|nr:hypothetical protein [Halosimplex carlsbadense]ELZ30498.1 hypothetical protein C475_00100 [Halosimplex carlsbadense 2-9-1]